MPEKMVSGTSTMVPGFEKMVSGTSTMVSAFEKMVSRPEKIFSTTKTMVGTTNTMVKIDRRWKSHVVNNIMIVFDHGL